MKQQLHCKAIIIAAICIFFISTNNLAQVPPAGKYNTTNYAEDRKAIEALGMVKDSSIHLNDDYIAVGPEGKVSYGYDEWKKGLRIKAPLLNRLRQDPALIFYGFTMGMLL